MFSKMLANFYSKSSLQLEYFSKPDLKQEILNLSSKKGTRKVDTLVKELRHSIKAQVSELILLINHCFKKKCQPAASIPFICQKYLEGFYTNK